MEFALRNEMGNSNNLPFQLYINWVVENRPSIAVSDSYNGGTIEDVTGATCYSGESNSSTHDPGAPVSSDTSSNGIAYVTYLDDEKKVAGYVNAKYGQSSFYVVGFDKDEVDNMLTFLKSIAPEEEAIEENSIYVTFWAAGAHGPVSRRRKLEVPTWDDIILNYNGDVSQDIDVLMNEEFRPGRGGQLLLWHGEPGTGKTTALRAMSQKWKDWCEIHYITDPEAFFGRDADYMMSVMCDAQNEDKWRLLVLEDCGELLAADARVQLANPQGLSRFLNAVDGMLGQGLKFMVLVTTNEPLRKLHAAVTRPGRCLSVIEFLPLTPEESIEWANRNNISIEELQDSKILSELYAIADGAINTRKVAKSVGF